MDLAFRAVWENDVEPLSIVVPSVADQYRVSDLIVFPVRSIAVDLGLF
jgi:hypothetical protein